MEKIDSIKTTNKFLEYKDYLEIYNELDDKKIKVIINYYRDLLKQSFNSLIESEESILITLRFWKDFLFFFYLALIFIKDYKSNSIIISLGESPAKLVFTQSLFYDDKDIYNKLKLNYPINLKFKYLPLSKLSVLLFTIEETRTNGETLLRPFNEYKMEEGVGRLPYIYNYKEIIDLMNKNYNRVIEYNFKNYILNANIDPKNIIESDKNIIIVDRAEGMATLAAFFYLYTKLTIWTELSQVEKNIFFSKFSFYGFDILLNNDIEIKEKNKVIKNVKSFIKTLLSIDDSVLEKIIKFKLINYDLCQRNQVSSYIQQKLPSNKFYWGNTSLMSPYNTISNVIGFISVPEMLNLSSRCIKSYKLDNPLPENLLYEFKQSDKNSINCNFINFIIFMIFMKLKKTCEFDKLINNIDNINTNFFYKDIKTDIPIDEYLESLTDKQKFIDFFLDNPQIISKTIFNDEITFSYEETFNKNNFKNKYLKYKNKYLKYKKEFDLEN